MRLDKNIIEVAVFILIHQIYLWGDRHARKKKV
jgi:hypothetical protein